MQHAFTTLAHKRTHNEVVAAMLEAAYAPLGFSRAIYFAAGAPGGDAQARFQVVDGAVEPCTEIAELRRGSALLHALNDPSADGVGRAGELSAPLVDTRNWYVVTALVRGERMHGTLYADGHSSVVPREGEAALVRALGTIAAVALDNVTLLTQTQELATRDPLTGLFNRRAFGERLRDEIETARRHGRSLAYVLIDVDDFKAINDTHGHAGGDAVLCELAHTLQANSRPQDVVARYAGDEFIVLLVDVETVLARALVERLACSMRDRGLRCSLGVALLPDDATNAAELMGAADRALYTTKKRGKNGFSFAPSPRQEPGSGALGWEESTAIFQAGPSLRQTTR
ncbi:MAG: GGDEF domain-containing protein [Candidatus Eremiobacteraeota bacterium]|nr:GGDEF domain-containing protein [Candidatus Eremiobacteraeota bacterium]